MTRCKSYNHPVKDARWEAGPQGRHALQRQIFGQIAYISAAGVFQASNYIELDDALHRIGRVRFWLCTAPAVGVAVGPASSPGGDGIVEAAVSAGTGAIVMPVPSPQLLFLSNLCVRTDYEVMLSCPKTLVYTQ